MLVLSGIHSTVKHLTEYLPVKRQTRGLCGRDRMVVIFYQLQLLVQSVPITTNVVSSNPIYCEVYSIQHYVTKFVSDLRQVNGFLQVLRFPSPIKLTTTI